MLNYHRSSTFVLDEAGKLADFIEQLRIDTDSQEERDCYTNIRVDISRLLKSIEDLEDIQYRGKNQSGKD